MDHELKAGELFLQGYNCAQAVAVAFCDQTGLDACTAARLSGAFGGGFGRMREVCGAISGMMMVLGCLYGYDTPDDEAKKQLYTQAQSLIEAFRQQTGSILCRELLDNPPSDPNPSPRTAEYYAKRPCARMVMLAARLLDEFLAAHPVEQCHG